jgi:hypothetical protein
MTKSTHERVRAVLFDMVVSGWQEPSRVRRGLLRSGETVGERVHLLPQHLFNCQEKSRVAAQSSRQARQAVQHLSTGVTGEVIYVDCGYNIMGF